MKLYTIGKNEDAPHRSGDEGYAALVVRQDTIASLAGITGDYSMLSVDASGRLYVTLSGSEAASGNILAMAQTPVITVGAYTAGDTFGGLLTFPNAASIAGGAGYITKVQILSNVLQHSPIDLWLFNQTFTAGADNDPFSVTGADLLNCLGYIDIASSDYSSAANNEIATKTSGLRMPFEYVLAAGQTSLFGQMVIRSADTYGAVDDVTVVLTVERR